MNFVDQHEVGYRFDAIGGKVRVLEEKGYIVTLPFIVKIHTVDLRPFQVCISANSRVLNRKLVRFNPNGLLLFVSLHGRADYSAFGGVNGIDTSSDMYQIMMAYAFENQGSNHASSTYPFLEIIKETGSDSTYVQ